ncbi:MAG: hypothetical protein U9R42_13400, partial [Bacteroidota bacterium]|nr:hypothetical protein [Bacteroidota bacterium]
MHTLKFPEAFIKRMKIQLGDEAEDFFKSLKEEPAVSLRVNPAKNTGEYENEENIPWCKFGKYLNKKPEFVFDPIIHAGGYFVQDASSMFFHKAINFSKDIRVLELSASKGDNSTLLLSLMTENSILFSNRLPGGKASILAENIIKWGNANVIVSSNYSSAFKNFAAYFDVILIDAPSSLEGFFRKKTRTIEKWATNKAFQFSVNQKNILDDAISLLKKDGILIYTTQTYSLEENEQI